MSGRYSSTMDGSTTGAHQGLPHPSIRTRSMVRSSSLASVHGASSAIPTKPGPVPDHHTHRESGPLSTNKPQPHPAPRRSSTSTALSVKAGAGNSLRQQHPHIHAHSSHGKTMADGQSKHDQHAVTLGSTGKTSTGGEQAADPKQHPSSPSKPTQRGPQRSYDASNMLRSPPASFRRLPNLKPKRVSDFGVHSDAERPAKRLFTGSGTTGSVDTTQQNTSGQASLPVPIKRSTSGLMKPRRSTAGLPGPTSRPSLGPAGLDRPPPQARRSSALFEPRQTPSLAVPASSSSSLVGMSPSKFGLTIPREFTFSNSQSPVNFSNRLNLPTATLSPAKPLTKSMSSLSLAPSPIREDEHVPKPIFAPTRKPQHGLSAPQPPSMARSQSVAASLSGLNSQSSEMRAERASSIFPTSPLQQKPAVQAVPSPPAVVSPTKNGSPLRRTQLYDAYRSPSRSPVQAADLMQRTLEKHKTTAPLSAGAMKVPRLTFEAPQDAADKRPSHPAQTDPFGSLDRVSQGVVPASVPASAAEAVALPLFSPSSNTEDRPRRSPGHLPSHAEAQLRSTASPSKRPWSPDDATSTANEADRSTRLKRPGMARSASTSALSHSAVGKRTSTRRSGRQLASSAPAPAATSQPNNRNLDAITADDGVAARQNTFSFTLQPKQAQPPSGPPVSPKRAATCPTITVELSPENETAISNESQTSVSDTTMDIDTSVMSASGHAHLANLQSLLSKMSAPRQSIGSRRSSYAGPSSSAMGLLDERAELEAEQLATSTATRGDPTKSGRLKSIPRYAAPTTSSSARYASAYSDSTVPLRNSANAPSLRASTTATNVTQAANAGTVDAGPARSNSVLARRRISVGVPIVRKGNLVPLATSSNAGKNVMARSAGSTESSAPVDIDNYPQAPSAPFGGEAPPALPETATVLKNVVAFVDVKTAEGDEAGGVFVDILRSLGARVLSRPTDSVTHIIYKGGKPATLHRYRAYRDPKPFLLGVGWIVKCREMNERVEEKPFTLNPDNFDAVLFDCKPSGAGSGVVGGAMHGAPSGGSAVRRKSLEPRILVAQPSHPTAMEYVPTVARNIFGSTLQVQPAHGAELDRARRRTLQFAPRIGSPLKQRVFNAFEADEDAMDEE